MLFITTDMELKRSILSLLALCTASFCAGNAQESSSPSANYLWYKKPADITDISTPWNGVAKNYQQQNNNGWEKQALPIGNGRIGAMIFGGDSRERLALNENSFWSGGLNPGGGYGYGPEAGDNDFGSFQPFADLIVDFGGTGEAQNYSRALSLDEGVASVSYTKDGVDYKRETYASFPNQVIVMTCTASKPGALDAKFMLKPNHTATLSAKDNTLTMSGTLKNGMKFEGKAVIIANGGTVKTEGGSKKIDVSYTDNQPVFDTAGMPYVDLSKATSVTVIISLATDYEMNFKKKWKGAAPEAKNNAYLAKAVKMAPEALKAAHLANYKSLFDRVKLDLGKTDEAVASLPTDERIKAYKTSKNDPDLEETLFQYGRYALISSSRPGSLPANLQGLWNDNVHQAWACDYHSNINLQMNYWLAEPANLAECQQPLIDFFEGMAEPSRIAAQKEFKSQTGGPVRGWTVRTSQNPFGGQGWQWNIPGSAWYALHMWEHYIFNMDKKYLKEQAYPMMKEICQFWEDHLKELGKDGEGFTSDDKNIDLSQLKGLKAGTLVAPHGWSPEQGPREDGVAHDQQLIWDLFNNTIKAAGILGVDKQWANDLAKKRDKLAAPKISPEGDLQEWMIDRPGMKRGHRHTSHLFAVYPGSQISLEKTPALAKAAEKSLELRGTDGDCRRSWTWPWRTALWARFKDGEKAHEMVSGLIEHNLLDNMLATHPPMQMDGTFGITAGMAEMLIQSHNLGEIALLPAPTKAWPSGSVKGLKARGNVTVNFDWKDGKVTNVELFSPSPRKMKVTYNGASHEMMPKPLPASGKKAAPKAAK